MKFWSLQPQQLLLSLLLLAAHLVSAQEYKLTVIGEAQTIVQEFSVTGQKLLLSDGLNDEHRLVRFASVGYAQPPVGSLRFVPPKPARYTADVNATLPAPACPQGPGSNPAMESENCLYMSVRTPDLNGSAPILAVLSASPSGVDAGFGDAFVATQAVAMATIESRRGALGYLWLQQDDLTVGNLGLLDQQLALQFLAEWAASFGGDASRVTLAGHGTAAAAETGLQAVAPGSGGLFQRVAMLGGSIASPLAWYGSADVAEPLSWNFAQMLGCNGSDTGALLPCLQSVKLADLLQAESQLAESRGRFLPVGEGDFFAANASINATEPEASTPDALWRSGVFEGATLVGAAVDAAGEADVDALAPGLDWEGSVTPARFRELVSQAFRYYPRTPAETTEAARSLLNVILTDWPNSQLGDRARRLLARALGDFRYGCPVWQAASELVRFRDGNTDS